jgi:hypothetical protein
VEEDYYEEGDEERVACYDEGYANDCVVYQMVQTIRREELTDGVEDDTSLKSHDIDLLFHGRRSAHGVLGMRKAMATNVTAQSQYMLIEGNLSESLLRWELCVKHHLE